MELQFLSTTDLVLAIFFLFLISVVIVKATNSNKSKNSASNLPPGPWKLPLVGNIHQLVVSPLVHHTLRDLANKHGPLMHLQLGEISTVVVSSPEMAREIMKTHDKTFANRPYLVVAEMLAYNSSTIGFSPYGDYWKQLRKISMMELLSSQRVQTFRVVREEEVMNLVASISSDAGEPINLSRRIFSLTHGIIARAAFGLKSEHQEDFIPFAEETTALATGFSISDMYPSVKCLRVVTGMRNKLEKLHKRIDKVLQVILDEHKEREGRRAKQQETKSEDLVDVLLRIQKNGDLQFALSDDNIKAIILEIFTAGSETSSTTVEWVISELMRNPEVMKRTQAEIRDVFGKKGNVDESGLHELEYLKLVIKETLRLRPAAPLLVPRECSKDCEINGYTIPAKTKAIINWWAIARDPKYWIQPEKFNPERYLDSGLDFKGYNYEYIPFGGGRRICPGIAFAYSNMELPLAQLLYHFDWKIPGGLKHEELDMTEAFGFSVRRKNDLHLIPIPYRSSNV